MLMNCLMYERALFRFSWPQGASSRVKLFLIWSWRSVNERTASFLSNPSTVCGKSVCPRIICAQFFRVSLVYRLAEHVVCARSVAAGFVWEVECTFCCARGNSGNKSKLHSRAIANFVMLFIYLLDNSNTSRFFRSCAVVIVVVNALSLLSSSQQLPPFPYCLFSEATLRLWARNAPKKRIFMNKIRSTFFRFMIRVIIQLSNFRKRIQVQWRFVWVRFCMSLEIVYRSRLSHKLRYCRKCSLICYMRHKFIASQSIQRLRDVNWFRRQMDLWRDSWARGKEEAFLL